MTEVESEPGSFPGLEVPTGLAVGGLLVLAAVAGLAAAFAPVMTVVLVAAVLVGVVSLVRVEWTAMLVVATAPFEDYLRLLHEGAVRYLAVVLVVGWAARRLSRPDRSSLEHPLVAAAAALLMVLLAATAVAPNPPTGPEIALRYVGFLVAMVVLFDLVRRGMPVERLARAFVASCALAAAAGLVTFLSGDEARVGGPLEDPNDLAFFMLVALPFALGLRRASSRRWPYDLAFLLLLVGLAGTLSRGAFIGLAAMVVLAVLWQQVRASVVAGLLVLTVVGVGAVALAVPEQVDDSLRDKSSIADQNVDDRLGLWRVAGEMTLQNPVLGLGPGGFPAQFDEYSEGLPLVISPHLDVAHNMYLEVSSQMGLPGLVAFLAVLWIGGRCALRRWRHDANPMAAATATALVGAAAAATFLSEQYFLPVWMLAAFGAGLWPLRDQPTAPDPDAFSRTATP